jgi:uncharacterized protein (TIGR02996 family)
MPRYELRTEKFWEVMREHRVVITRAGKLGMSTSRTDGKTMHASDPGRVGNRTCRDAATAREKLRTMVDEKLAEGYRLVDGTDPLATPSPSIRDAALEANLVAAGLEDPAPFLVYADFLQTRADPRGELIQFQHAMRSHSDPASYMKFKKLEEALRRQHARAWLGDTVVDAEHRCRLEWRLGFVDHAILHASNDPAGTWIDPRQRHTGMEIPEHGPTVAELVAALLASPAGLCVRHLTLQGTAAQLLDALPSLPSPTLRELSLRTYGDDDSQLEAHRARLTPVVLDIRRAGY